MTKEANLNSEQIHVGSNGWFVKYIAQVSPATKLIIFYAIAGLFCFLTATIWLLIYITAVYAIIIPVLLIFMPDRVWSEPTMLEWYKLGLGHKGGKVIDVVEGEIVQPVLSEHKENKKKLGKIVHPKQK